VLRTAVAILGDGNEINVTHLSDDFLEQLHDYETLANRTVSNRQISSPLGEPGRLDHLESCAIRHAVIVSNGNISAAARGLGISRNTLYRKMHTLGI